MARDTSLAARRTVIAEAKQIPAVAAIVGQKVYSRVPEQVVWPYVRYGVDDTAPFRATGIDGANIQILLHAFHFGETDDDCRALNSALSDNLGERVLDLTAEAGFPAKMTLRWIRSQMLRDTERVDGWHGIVQFVGTVVS